MALRLVRKSSETPNITNKDDTKMIRYAYGGYNGFVENYGSEIASVTPSANGIFKIGSGRIVLQGWEVDVDDSGWELVYDNITGTRYYSIYLEISIETETATVKSSYNTGTYPEINIGDDLTEFPNGTTRLLLWQVQANGKTVVQANKVVQKINYAKDVFADIERRLDELGFKQGVVEWHGSGTPESTLYKEGNTVHFSFSVYSEIKRGDIIIPEEFRPAIDSVFYAVSFSVPFYVGVFCRVKSDTGIVEVNSDITINNIQIENVFWRLK